jgi:hypothetical protein
MCPKCQTKDIEPYKSKEVIHTKRKGRVTTEKKP